MHIPEASTGFHCVKCASRDSLEWYKQELAWLHYHVEELEALLKDQGPDWTWLRPPHEEHHR